MPRRLVIFDIDGTLVPGQSSEIRFVRYLWRRRVIGPRQLFAFAWFCIRYAPAYRHQVLQKNKAWLYGLEQARIRALAGEFTRHALVPVLYEPVLERLRAHKASGHHVTLLSGTPQFLADALVHELGVQAAHGAVCHTRNNVYTMAPPSRHPYGATKIDGARQLAEAAGLALADAVAYGDSVHDAHLFHMVGKAVAVRPDDDLQAVAVGEGWEIMSQN